MRSNFILTPSSRVVLRREIERYRGRVLNIADSFDHIFHENVFSFDDKGQVLLIFLFFSLIPFSILGKKVLPLLLVRSKMNII